MEFNVIAKTVEHKSAFFYYKKRNKGLLNYLKTQSKNETNIIGDLADEPIITARKE